MPWEKCIAFFLLNQKDEKWKYENLNIYLESDIRTRLYSTYQIINVDAGVMRPGVDVLLPGAVDDSTKTLRI